MKIPVTKHHTEVVYVPVYFIHLLSSRASDYLNCTAANDARYNSRISRVLHSGLDSPLKDQYEHWCIRRAYSSLDKHSPKLSPGFDQEHDSWVCIHLTL